ADLRVIRQRERADQSLIGLRLREGRVRDADAPIARGERLGRQVAGGLVAVADEERALDRAGWVERVGELDGGGEIRSVARAAARSVTKSARKLAESHSCRRGRSTSEKRSTPKRSGTTKRR